MSKKYKKKNEMKLAYDYSEVLKNKIKIIRKSTLKRGGVYMGIYAIFFALFYMAVRLAGIKVEMVEIITAMVLLMITLVVLLVINMIAMIGIEKKLYMIDTVDPELQKTSVENFRDILKKRDTSKILEMYRDIYIRDRRKVDISLKTIFGSALTIVLSSIVTYMMAKPVVFEDSDIGTIYFVAVTISPYILEILVLFLNVIEDDVIGKKPVIERYVQDCIVKELAMERLGIDINR